jgi:hypothetical protein
MVKDGKRRLYIDIVRAGKSGTAKARIALTKWATLQVH